MSICLTSIFRSPIPRTRLPKLSRRPHRSVKFALFAFGCTLGWRIGIGTRLYLGVPARAIPPFLPELEPVRRRLAQPTNQQQLEGGKPARHLIEKTWGFCKTRKDSSIRPSSTFLFLHMGSSFASESGSGAGVLVQSNTGVRVFFFPFLSIVLFHLCPAVPFLTPLGHACHSFLGACSGLFPMSRSE